MPVDLHIHTTCSDGTSTPAEVVALSLGARLSAIALTDHDAIDGVEAARIAARGAIEVIAGVELSAQSTCAPDVHLLGYFVDLCSPALIESLASLRASRLARAVAMTQLLAEAGYRIAFEDVRALAGAGTIGRSHIARALVASGEVPSFEHAFEDLIGANAPCYVAKRALSVGEAVALVHDAGGVVVLAHPGVSGDGALGELVEAGLDGIEAYHAEHTPRQRAHYASLAARLGLVVTGGSDYHGRGTRSAVVGAGGCPDSAVAALRARAPGRPS